MKQAILYIHGKNGSPDEAEHYKPICTGYDVFGLDYHGETPYDTKDEILAFYDDLSKDYTRISIIANSIGAFFAMNALQERKIFQAFLISPIVDMEKLIADLMTFAGVSERELEAKGEIDTAFGEKLSWEYLLYVRKNPIIWNVKTYILYGENDNLTSYETISKFAERINANLTIMKNGEHWFHTDEQLAFLDDWLRSSIK